MASEYQTLLDIEAAGNLNPVQRTRLEELKQQGGGNPLGIPAFNFDYDLAEREAFAKLKPYYEQKLREAEGDVERAKGIIEEDYARGVRFAEEDTATQLAEHDRLKQDEIFNTLAELNKRGILAGQIDPGANERGESRAPVSDIAQRFTLGPLTERQKARRDTIERALRRQQEVQGVEKQRGLQALDIELPRFKRGLEEEKARRVQTEFVPLARERALARYNEGPGRTIQQYLQRSS